MYGSLDCLNASALGEHGVVCVGFTDYRDAEHAFMATKISRPDWRLTRLAPKAYALKKGDGATTNAVRVTDFESQVVVSVFFNQHDPNIEAASTFQLVKQALSSFGDIKAIHSLPHEQGNVRDIRVEFFDTKAAFLAVQSLREVQLGVSLSSSVLIPLANLLASLLFSPLSNTNPMSLQHRFPQCSLA